MIPSELKELLEKLGCSKTYGYCEPESWENWWLPRLKGKIDTPFDDYDFALIKEEIRFALREEGYRGITLSEEADGTHVAVAHSTKELPCKMGVGPDELHALADLWKKVKK